MHVNIEIKNDPGEVDFDPAESVAAAVIEITAADPGRVLISSFHLPTIDAVRSAAPALATAWLVHQSTANVLEVLVAHGHRVLHPWDRMVDAELIERCHRAGVAVNVWTVDDPDRMRQLIAWGVDGICTNVPDVLVGVLSR
jgi:glycerophosphoryl diester phosphodiesterase